MLTSSHRRGTESSRIAGAAAAGSWPILSGLRISRWSRRCRWPVSTTASAMETMFRSRWVARPGGSLPRCACSDSETVPAERQRTYLSKVLTGHAVGHCWRVHKSPASLARSIFLNPRQHSPRRRSDPLHGKLWLLAGIVLLKEPHAGVVTRAHHEYSSGCLEGGVYPEQFKTMLSSAVRTATETTKLAKMQESP
jgi:hypothetical protein